MKVVRGTVVLESLEEIADPKHTALLIIDMQNDLAAPTGLIGASEGTAWVNDIIPRIKAVLDEARTLGLLVVFTKVVKSVDGSCESGPRLRFLAKVSPTLPRATCIEGTWGAEVIDELRPRDDEPQITKYRSSSLIATPLDMVLRNKGIKSAVVVGIVTWGCVEATVRDLNQYGYYPVALSDCVSSRQRDLHEAGLLMMESYADVVTSSELLAVWRAAAARHIAS